MKDGTGWILRRFIAVCPLNLSAFYLVERVESNIFQTDDCGQYCSYYMRLATQISFGVKGILGDMYFECWTRSFIAVIANFCC